MGLCLSCREIECNERPYCVFCTFAIAAEVKLGLLRLSDYLARHAEFSQWEREHVR